MNTPQITVRIPPDVLARLEALGKQMKPKALNRSEMINVAIAEYIFRNGGMTKAKQPRK